MKNSLIIFCAILLAACANLSGKVSEQIKTLSDKVSGPAQTSESAYADTSNRPLPTANYADTRKTVVGAGRRLALVIGNASYHDAPLTNPLNDARDIKKTLGSLGYQVAYHENVGQREMEDAIRNFAQSLRGGDTEGLLYYSGHGVQVDGENYLIPVDANGLSKADIKYKAVNANYVLDLLTDAHNRLNIVILDSCRDNPFRGLRGGGRGFSVMGGLTGSLLAFSTSPGNTAEDGDGRNSPYTQALLKHLPTPGIPVEEMFKRVRVEVEQQTGGRQTPWENSSLRETFCFKNCTAPNAFQEGEVARLQKEKARMEEELAKMREKNQAQQAQLQRLEKLEQEKAQLLERLRKTGGNNEAQADLQQQLERLQQEKSRMEAELGKRENLQPEAEQRLKELEDLRRENARYQLEMEQEKQRRQTAPVPGSDGNPPKQGVFLPMAM